MNKISAKIFFTKTIFPLFWFGFLAFFLVVSIKGGAYKQSLMFLLMPCFMAFFGYFLMKKLVWDLVDEVYDCGDFLMIKNRGMEDKIQLSNIMNLSASTNMNPPRITLRLTSPSKFGKEIAFSPTRPFSLNPFAKNPLVEDLMVRVDQARSKRAV
jgi:hypothetical protein